MPAACLTQVAGSLPTQPLRHGTKVDRLFMLIGTSAGTMEPL